MDGGVLGREQHVQRPCAWREERPMKLEHGELSGQVAGGEGGMGRAQHSQGLQAMLSAMGSIQHFKPRR